MIVLHAEDDFDDFDMLTDILSAINPAIKTINVRNGAETLEFLDNATILPDMIFLDINMPAMDGKACLKHIKKDEKYAKIPVIIFSTSSSALDIEQCKQLGADYYVSKPTTMKEGVEALRKVVNAHAR